MFLTNHTKIKANLRVESLKLDRLIVAFTIFGVIEHIFHLHSLRIDSGISDTLIHIKINRNNKAFIVVKRVLIIICKFTGFLREILN